jgi:hypothetical protein
MANTRRALVDLTISAAALCTLLLTLAAFDGRLREEIVQRMRPGRPAAELAQAGATVRSLTSVVLVAVREQSIEHAPLVMFALAATVLVLFMLRT